MGETFPRKRFVKPCTSSTVAAGIFPGRDATIRMVGAESAEQNN